MHLDHIIMLLTAMLLRVYTRPLAAMLVRAYPGLLAAMLVRAYT